MTERDLIAENDALRRRLARLEAIDGSVASSDVAANTAAYHRVLEAAGIVSLELDEQFRISQVTPISPRIGTATM